MLHDFVLQAGLGMGMGINGTAHLLHYIELVDYTIRYYYIGLNYITLHCYSMRAYMYMYMYVCMCMYMYMHMYT